MCADQQICKEKISSDKCDFFLKQIYEAIVYGVDNDVLVFNTDFSKAFDRVPLSAAEKSAFRLPNGKETILKGGKLLIGRTRCNERCITTIFAGTITLLHFHKRLTRCSKKFSEPYIIADDLKILSEGKKREEVQEDLNSIEMWVAENGMTLALDECTNQTCRGKDETYQICAKN